MAMQRMLARVDSGEILERTTTRVVTQVSTQKVAPEKVISDDAGRDGVMERLMRRTHSVHTQKSKLLRDRATNKFSRAPSPA